MGSPVPAASLILLADADADNRDLLSEILRLENFRIAEASDGPNLVESAARLQPQLILTELRLRRLDGFEAARRLKADPATAGIPIVALTGYTPQNLEEKAREAGIEQVLLKPIAPENLLAAVRRVLAASQALRAEHQTLSAEARELREQTAAKRAEVEAVAADARRLLEESRRIVDPKPRR